MSEVMSQIRRYRERVGLRGTERYEDDESQTQQAVALMQALRKASDAREAVQEIVEAQDAVEETRQAAAAPVVDEGEGVDEQPLELPVDSEGLESQAEHLEVSKVRVDSEALSSMVELIDSLAGNIDKASEVLSEVLVRVGETQDIVNPDIERTPVDGSDGLARALAFGDQLPGDLPSSLLDYAGYVKNMMTVYVPAALKGAEAAVSLPNGLSVADPATFWNSVEREFKRIIDPRLSVTVAGKVLPNAGEIFHDTMVGTIANVQAARVSEYVNYQAPATSFEIQSEFEGTDEECQIPALTYTQVRLVVRALLEALSTVDLSHLKSQGLPIWRDLSSAEATCRSFIAAAPYALGPEAGLVPKVLSTAYRLSSVTVLQLITSLVLTCHAVALLCERSLDAPLNNNAYPAVASSDSVVAANSAPAPEPEVDSDVDVDTALDGDDGQAPDENEGEEVTDAQIDDALDPDTPPPPMEDAESEDEADDADVDTGSEDDGESSAGDEGNEEDEGEDAESEAEVDDTEEA